MVDVGHWIVLRHSVARAEQETLCVVPSTCSIESTLKPYSSALRGTLSSGSPSLSNTSSISPLSICANLSFVLTKPQIW